MPPLQTTVTELGESRVRVEVEVDATDVERSVERSARALARELRIPGFRAGKAPPAIVIQRLGRATVLEQTLKESLAEWYERALLDSGVASVGDPSLDIGSLPDEGEPLSFSFEVAVRPKARLGSYRGLEVGRREPEVPGEAVDAELDRLREGFATLEAVERAAAEGDFLLVDFEGTVDGEPFEGGEARDYLLELGVDQLIEGFEQQLSGAEAGEERSVEVSFPADYRAEELAGKDAVFAVTVKEVREKRLPELDDDFASDVSEHDTLAELREDIAGKIGHALEHQIEDEFRRAVVDSAVREAKVEVPAGIVAVRAEESWERLEHSLSHRGMDSDRYLQMVGKTREQVIEEARPDAEQSLKREAVLEAVADAEELEVGDEELLESLAPAAEREGTSAEKLLERLKKSGRDVALRADLLLRKAADLLVESATAIPVEQAKAREKLWTPERGAEEAGEAETPGLWTPRQPR